MLTRTLSRLMISDVKTKQDSGEYSCSPTDLSTAVVTVHVQRGKYTLNKITLTTLITLPIYSSTYIGNFFVK